ncbi:MAG: VCBS repeat-containing protein [Bryobacteraceae bacterium]
MSKSIPLLILCAALAAQTIEHEGFQMFRTGTFGNAGANLYVSRAGRVQTVNRWDLNNDGFLDILISNDHDNQETVDAFVYWNSPTGFRSLLPELWKERPLAQTVFGWLAPGNKQLTRLPSFGGGRSLIADLNRDGFPDLVFCNYIHNYPGIRSAYLYWGSAKGFNAANKIELPTNWAAGVAAADLNRDGFLDLVFANQGAEAGLENLSRDLGLDSFIYWGSARGFDTKNPGHLPTRGARDVVIADINGDQFPDVAFLNGARDAKEVQVFWGGTAPHSAARMQAVPVPDPTAIRAADVDGDGKADLVIATAGGRQTVGTDQTDAGEPQVLVMHGSATGLDPKRTERLPAASPRDVAVVDMNADGLPDIAVANAEGSESFVYWGAKSGFDPERRTALPTMSANGVAAGDFNGDGNVDIAFANSHDDQTYDVASYIYWGSKQGFAPYLRSELQSFGAASVTAGDLDGDRRPELVFINQYSGRYAGRQNSFIFWGNPHHHYSTASMARLPTEGAYDTTVADFDDDGYADILFTNAYIQSAFLYYGSRYGYSTGRRQVLEAGAAHASNAADLNRDGYLDLIISGTVNGKPRGTILWGSDKGFSTDRATVLALKAKRNALTQVVADFNRDGWLDLSFSDHYFGSLEIYWGGEKGYSSERMWTRQMQGGGLSVADLNGDGVLDFVVPGMFNAATKSYDNRTRVYLGTADGTPAATPIADVEAFGSIECAIADFNRDSKLDLACTNYMSDKTRSLPMFVYWGLGGGKFSDRNRTVLPAESSAGIQPLDLNDDGYPDLVVHNHLKDGDHSIRSYIYWNEKGAFDAKRREELPTFGPHFSQMTPVGGVMTRRLEEQFVSEAVEAGGAARLSWKAQEPRGSKLMFETRSADTREALDRAPWASPLETKGRWLQYRARFTSSNAASWPVLEKVTITVAAKP